MHVMFINNEGEGFAKKVEIEEGTSIGDFVTGFLADQNEKDDGDRGPNDYKIKVNRENVAADQVLTDGDRITMTPTKIEGAK